MPHRYFYLNRPPAYAHQPSGFTEWNGGTPSKDWYTSDGTKITSFGWVEYPEPLSLEDIWRFELLPDNTAERAHYHFWQEANRDPSLAAALETEAMTMLTQHALDFQRHNDPEITALVAALVHEMVMAHTPSTTTPKEKNNG